MKRLFLTIASAAVFLTLAGEGFPAASITTCGKTITSSGSYVLKKSLIVKASGGACITVSASNVTLDLGSYSISCVSPVDAITDQGQALSGRTVRNGMIYGCKNGTALGDSTGVSLEEVVPEQNVGTGIILGVNSTVTYSISDFNQGDGIHATCPANLSYNAAIGNLGLNLDLTGSGCNVFGNAAP
jgi:hypothetical protein